MAARAIRRHPQPAIRASSRARQAPRRGRRGDHVGSPRGIADNAADPERVRAIGRRLRRAARAAHRRPGRLTPTSSTRSTTSPTLELLVDLAAEYDAAKRARGAVDYTDQVVLALRAVQRRPEIGGRAAGAVPGGAARRIPGHLGRADRSARARSSHGTAVTAVGDPNQSIYGWRGASASNLGAVPAAVPAQTAAPPAFTLVTSWRNGIRILDAANRWSVGQAPTTGCRPSYRVPGRATSRSTRPSPRRCREEAVAVAAWFARPARRRRVGARAIRPRRRRS